jgi:hypothetical protein
VDEIGDIVVLKHCFRKSKIVLLWVERLRSCFTRHFRGGSPRQFKAVKANDPGPKGNLVTGNPYSFSKIIAVCEIET